MLVVVVVVVVVLTLVELVAVVLVIIRVATIMEFQQLDTDPVAAVLGVAAVLVDLEMLMHLP